MDAMSNATELTPFFRRLCFGNTFDPAADPTTLNRRTLDAAAAAADAADAPVNRLLLLLLLLLSWSMYVCEMPLVGLLLLLLPDKCPAGLLVVFSVSLPPAGCPAGLFPANPAGELNAACCCWLLLMLVLVLYACKGTANG